MTTADKMEGLRAAWQKSPQLYAKQYLGVNLWERQIQITNAIMKHKRVFVQASHGVGKSFVAATMVNWHFDSFDPSITLTTAPNAQQVQDVLWREVRMQRRNRNYADFPLDAPDFLQPKNSRMESRAEHFAVGLTAKTGDAFQGKHEESIGIIFDEATGIGADFYEASEGMMTNANGMAWWLAICNPTDTASRAYEEVLSGEWYVMDISAMHHPNVIATLRGEPLPYPKAVGIGYIDKMVRRYAEEINQGDMKAGDIEWALPRPDGTRGDTRFWRPGAMLESRVLGRWPRNASGSIWSDAMWTAAIRRKEDQTENDNTKPTKPETFMHQQVQIGCDVAWGGGDFTTIVARRGNVALHWETHNGWTAPQIADGLKKVARLMADQHKEYFSPKTDNYVGEDPHRMLMVVDHDATGNAVLAFMDDWNIVTQSGMSPALEEDDYPNRRSELWFTVAELANDKKLDLSRLPQIALNKMRSQAMAPTYKITPRGRQVEPKDETRRRIKRSPDDMDALNLAFCIPTAIEMRMTMTLGENGRPVGIVTGRTKSAGRVPNARGENYGIRDAADELTEQRVNSLEIGDYAKIVERRLEKERKQAQKMTRSGFSDTGSITLPGSMDGNGARKPRRRLM